MFNFLSHDLSDGEEEGGEVKNGRKSEVLRMKSPIVENVRTSSDIVLHTSRGLQLPYRKIRKKYKTIFSPYYSAIYGPHCYQHMLDSISE